MRTLVLLFAVALSACSTVQHKSLTASADYQQFDSQYHYLVSSLQDDVDLDTLMTLRKVYVSTSYYNPYNGPESALSKTMFKAISEQNWQRCATDATNMLSTNYISLNAHYGAMVCAYESGNTAGGDYHRTVLEKLLEAIWATGNGRTAETAFYCTSTPELYAFIQLQGLEATGQSLVQEQNKSYDLMGIKDPEGDQQFNWYFDISAQWTRGFEKLSNPH